MDYKKERRLLGEEKRIKERGKKEEDLGGIIHIGFYRVSRNPFSRLIFNWREFAQYLIEPLKTLARAKEKERRNKKRRKREREHKEREQKK